MEYSFELYFTLDELEKAYIACAVSIKEEVKKNLGIAQTNLSDHYYKDYWKRKCNTKWLNGGDWEFLWKRSGREPIYFNGIDKETFLRCCVAHLQGCMVYSYDYCDFQEKWYGKEDMAKHSLQFFADNQALLCTMCGTIIKACESDKYCARCYRDVLNNWRPL